MLAAKRTQDNFNRKKRREGGDGGEEKFLSLSAAFDRYESRQMEIVRGARALTNMKWFLHIKRWCVKSSVML